VFLVLLWGVHAPIVRRPVIPPVLSLGGAAVVILLPLAAGLVGLAGVVVALAATCSALVGTTILTRRPGSPVRRGPGGRVGVQVEP
jgi:hypothetical protein